MPRNSSNTFFAGYRVGRDIDRVEFFGEHLPARIVTVSDCLGALVPHSWATLWPRMADVERVKLVEENGFDAAVIPEMRAIVDQLNRTDELLWPDYVQTVDGVRRVTEVDARLRGGVPRVLGVGLSSEAFEILEREARENERREGTLFRHLEKQIPIPPGGTVLGWEPVCFSWGSLACSWHCNGLAKDFVSRMSARPNQHGFIDDLDLALSFCKLVIDENLGEPELWLPWLVVDYTAALTPGTTVVR